MQDQKGFTIIELLVVVLIFAILTVVVFVTINPQKRISEFRDSERWQAVRLISDSLIKYKYDHENNLPDKVVEMEPDLYFMIGQDQDGCQECPAVQTETACIDIDYEGVLVDEYLYEMPIDPRQGSAVKTGYYISKSRTGKITVGACQSELRDIKIAR